MFDIIHLLAKEYGWSKNQILDEMYYDEIEFYVKRIQKEQINNRLTELAIVQNPHSEAPNKLFTSFQKQLQEFEGKSFLDKDRMTKEDEENLKGIARRMMANAAKRRG